MTASRQALAIGVRKGVSASSRPSTVLVVPAIAVTLLALLPIAFVVVAAVGSGWSVIGTLLIRPRVAELLLGTAGLVLVGVPACVVLGVGTAWVAERSSIPGRRIFAVLFAAPLAIPAFVSSYAWATMIPALSGLWAGVLITSLAYYPLVYLPAAATLRGLDPALEETARALGRSPARVAWSIVLPQLRLPILGGSLLVGLHLLAEYGAFAMVRFETFTTAIMTQYRASFGGPAANVLAGVLVVACVFVLVLEGVARGNARFARIGPGVAKPAPRVALGRLTVPVVLLAGALVVLALGVPIANIVRWLGYSGMAGWAERWLPQATLTSIGYGVAGGVICTLAALPVAYLAARHPGRLSRVLESCQYLSSSLPGIVIALALVTVAVNLARPAYQTLALVLVAYVLMFLPRALVSLRAGLAQVPVGLEESSRSMGLSPGRTFLRVTGPLILPAALAGGALVFLGTINELTATLLLAPTGTRTLAIQFWTHVNNLDYGQAAPYAAVMVLLSMPVAYLLFRSSRLGSSS
jgi:iron(III) transport system permease protein